VPVTVSQIKASFPELELSDAGQDALIAVKLAEAQNAVDYSIFEDVDNADSCVKYLTAHLMALAPSGIKARLAKSNGETLYYQTYRRLLQAAAFGFRVP